MQATPQTKNSSTQTDDIDNIEVINENEATDTEEDKRHTLVIRMTLLKQVRQSVKQSVRQTQMMMTNQSPTILAIIMMKKMILIMIIYGLTAGTMMLMKTLRENLARSYQDTIEQDSHQMD